MNTDAELLTRFASSGDEAAFRGIVERHAPMVRGVAWRRTQNQALTDEITQTVFAILARKASGLRHAELAGWLHRTAFMETRNVCRKEARRGEALRELSQQMNEETAPDNQWLDIEPHLDEALTHLGADERQLVVMRYFEQRSYREIAESTGRTEEASRKRMQRSLDRLGAMLRRKGIATSGTALATLLAGQSLCVPGQGAAAIAAAALQGASAVPASTLLTHTFLTMTASTILKTSIVTVALAAIPLTLLWQENSTLKREVRELKSARSIVAKVVPKGPLAGDSETASAAAAAKKIRPGSGAAKDESEESLAGLFDGGQLFKLAGTQMKQEASREVNRLALRLNLTPEQKQKLQEFYEENHLADMKDLEEAAESGLILRAFHDEASLTEEERKTLAAMEDEQAGEAELETKREAFLAKLLTPEQLAEYEKSREEKRISDAEEHAQSMVTSLSGQMDLTPDQKDRLFQALANRKLTIPPGEPAPAPAGEPSSPAAVPASLVEMIAAGDAGEREVIRGILTPEQYQAYERYQQEEAKNVTEMLKMFVPAAKKEPKP